jgi:predicted permease
MTIWTNLQYAFRQLRKSPVFALTVIGTLALCIGANTAIYTIVDALFFRPLPYPNPERLVMITTSANHEGASELDTSQDGRQWEVVRDHASFLDSAVYGSTSGVNLVAGGRVEYVQNQRVSANFFHVLGTPPLVGREFTRQEDVPNGPSLVILSYQLWQRVFHGESSVVGRVIDLRGAPYTVVGIIPENFRALPTGLGTDASPDVWTPLRPSTQGEGSGDNYGVIGRLNSGVTLAQANGQLNSIMRDLFSRMHVSKGVTIEEKALPLLAGITYDLSSRVHLMWGAVGLVLLIGCVNIAGILMARSATRSREFATRLALGASRARIVGELLTESIVLALLGGVAGLVVGQLALDGLLRLNPGDFTLTGPVRLDVPVMAVMLSLSLTASIFFGLFPALEASAVDLRSALSEAGRSNAGSRRQWKRQSLVFVEVALGVVLVASAGLLIRTFLTIANAGPGFDPHNLMIASASIQDERYATAAAGSRLFQQSLQRIRAIPGVESAAVALSSPYTRPLNDGLSEVDGRRPNQGITEFTYATPGMFETLRISLLRGRLFSDDDNAATARVAVVNEAFLRRYLQAATDPLGVSIKIENKEWKIIGVVNNVQEKNGIGPGGPIDRFPEVYVPVDQFPDGIFAMANIWFSPVWIVRTHGDSGAVATAMQKALASIDPRLPFSSFKTMSDVRGAALQQQRYQATIFSVLAALATLLASLGLYGLIAQSVAQRKREMGIRLALGATVNGIIRAAAGPGIALSLAGIAFGIVLALFATRLLKSQIWGVAPSDPATFITVALMLICVAAAASIIPALRLVRLDPAQTLRDE